MPDHVNLGKHELPCYPQPPMRIIKRLGRLRDAFAGVGDAESAGEAFLANLGDRVYYLFQTFVPNLPERMPEFEFWGYASRDAFDAGDFDEDRDGKDAATFPQWLTALDVIVDVNGGKRFLALLKAVVPEEWLKVMIAEIAEGLKDAMSGSPSSLSGNGELPQSDSGPTGPTEEHSGTDEDASATG